MEGNLSFSILFKKYRLRAEFNSLSDFGRELASEGYFYEDSIFSRWQKGDRIPGSRKLLITIVKMFIRRGSINSLKEANIFIESAGQGYITDAELCDLNLFKKEDL